MLLRLLSEVLFSRLHWRIAIVASSLIATLLGLLGPFYQKEFVDSLASGGSYQSLLIAFICLAAAMSLNMLSNYLGMQESLQMQQVLANKLYHHTLHLRTDSLKGKPTGELVSIYATDIPGATALLELSLPQGSGIVFPLILAPWVLVKFLDIPVLPVSIGILSLVLLSFLLAYRQSVFFFQFKRLAADRIGLVSEWIQNIRTLRILGWVASFEKKIFEVREIETVNRIRMVTNGQTMNAISSSMSFFLNIFAVATLVYFSESPVTAGKLLAIMWIVAIFMTRSFRQLPWFFTFLFDSLTSLRRLEAILSLKNSEGTRRKETAQKLTVDPEHKKALVIKDLDLKIGEHHLLKKINFEIRNGEFVAIVGEVGSGKSLLLLSLLGETGASFNEYSIFGSNATIQPLDQLRQYFAFVPQEGFIMSASLRENVAFEYDFKNDVDEKIHRSLRRCQFDVVKERVEGGLNAEIGERGVNLSGGQKQRVSLARVDFYPAPIVLLDDCLSAVDVETENLLVEQLLKTDWQDRTRILVTHRLSVLEKADRVLFIADGELIAQGSFQELLSTNAKFRNYAASVAQDESRRAPKAIEEIADAESLVANLSPEKLETES